MKAYVGQTNLTLRLDTGNVLANVTTPKIKFKRPSGSQGEWTATVDGLELTHQFATGELSEAGTWLVWTYIVFTGGKISIGEPSQMIITKEGE